MCRRENNSPCVTRTALRLLPSRDWGAGGTIPGRGRVVAQAGAGGVALHHLDQPPALRVALGPLAPTQTTVRGGTTGLCVAGLRVGLQGRVARSAAELRRDAPSSASHSAGATGEPAATRQHTASIQESARKEASKQPRLMQQEQH